MSDSFRWAFWLTLITLVATLVVLGPDALRLEQASRLEAFDYLLLVYDVPGAALALCVLVLGGGSRIDPRDVNRLVCGVSKHIIPIAVVSTAVFAAWSVFVYRAHPLTMDEYSPYYQAQVFARGEIVARYPPPLLHWAFFPPFLHYFFVSSLQRGMVASAYWPGFALALTPFAKLGVPWLLNPLLAGTALLLIHRVAYVVFDGDSAGGWAVLLTLASPAFVINAISFYSMNAHMFANVLFALLLIKPTATRIVGAGVVGSWALALHNPVPHASFAAPFLIWLLRQNWRNLGWIVLGYFPASLLLVVGWTLVKASIGSGAAGEPAALLDRLQALFDSGFASPSVAIVGYRTIGVSKLVAWAVPGMVILAVIGGVRGLRRAPESLLFWAAVLTFAVYFVIPFNQGHGWGNRYFHSAWSVFPVLASGVLARRAPSGKESTDRLPGIALAWCCLSLGVLNGYRLYEVVDFVGQHLDQRPAVANDDAQYACFLKPGVGYYIQDLVQNNPELDAHVLYFASHGPQGDRLLLKRYAPGAELVDQGPNGAVYRLQGRPFADALRQFRKRTD